MKLEERFINYVKIDTMSDEYSSSSPSSMKQFDLAKLLLKELISLGVKDARLTNECLVYGTIEGDETKDTIALIAHMDTSPEIEGGNFEPVIIKNYDGKDIKLNDKFTLSPSVFPSLNDNVGDDLIVTDGNHLLGADDKAGIAIIMQIVEYYKTHPRVNHAPIKICFTPDEEVGAGVDHIDLNRLGAEYAYTVDGGGIGELEYENFNAASATVTITGRSVHPGEAKGKMINAAIVAREYDRRLTDRDRPEYTEGYEGFYHLTEINGCVESAKLKYILRDHNRQFFESKKRTMMQLADIMNRETGKEIIHVEIKDQYYNMKDKLGDAMFLVDNAKLAMEDIGIIPKIRPIRGGTDGAKLSYMGLPCPNLCAGGHNFHGRYEYICIQSMEKIVELLVKLISI